MRTFKALTRIDPAAAGFASAATRLLVAQIRKVSGRMRTVGEGVLTTDLPLGVFEKRSPHHTILHGAPTNDGVTFQFFPPGERTAIIHGPTYAGGSVVMSGFRAWRPTEAEVAKLRKAS